MTKTHYYEYKKRDHHTQVTMTVSWINLVNFIQNSKKLPEGVRTECGSCEFVDIFLYTHVKCNVIFPIIA